LSGANYCEHCAKRQPASGFEKVLKESPLVQAIAESPVGTASAKAFPWAAAALIVVIILLFMTGVGIPISLIAAIASFNYLRKVFQGKAD